MGLLDVFRRKALTADPGVVAALSGGYFNPYPALGGTNVTEINSAYQRGLSATYGFIYRTQPAVRSVVDYVANNAAQLGLKLYERVDDEERQRREDNPAAYTMANPDGRTPSDAFMKRLFSDWLIYDNAYVWKFRTGNPGDKLTLVRLRPERVTVSGGAFQADVYTYWADGGQSVQIPPEDMIHWFGYNPADVLLGLSQLETLRQELATDAAIQSALAQLAKSGLKGGYIKRPLEAPEWDAKTAERFVERFRQMKMRTDGADPVLEEGMEWEATGVTPKDAELIASRQFTKAEVADAYGIPMKALMEGNADARRALYADVLPPITKSLSCQLDVSVLVAEYGLIDYYFEFDLNEKLRGDLENRFPAMTAAAGAPWMTRNEVRAKENLPPIDGGDEIIVPLNVLEGDPGPSLPAPNVMPPQDPNKPPQDGSYRPPGAAANSIEIYVDGKKALPDGTVPIDHRISQLSPVRRGDINRQRLYVASAQEMLLQFYERQQRSFAGKSSTKSFDSARWNRELTAELTKFLQDTVGREANLYTGRLAGGAFDMAQVENYLKATGEGIALALNQVTQKDLEGGTATEAIDRAVTERAAIAGASIGTRATVFARREAAKQAPHTELRKQTWIADTDRHADLDGVSVPLDSDWGGIDPGTEPNCQCSVSIN